MITYQVEKFEDCFDEAADLVNAHYQEIATNKEMIPLDPNRERYQKLQDAGELHIVTVRADGKIIGYHATLVQTHLHYKSTLMGFTDLYYLDPDYRKSNVGRKMFAFVEDTLYKRGVAKLFTGTKCHQDHSKMFEYMGWTHTENLFTKVLVGE